MSARTIALEALKANHQWHQDHDEFSGYQASDMEAINIKAIAALEAEIAQEVEPVAHLHLPGADGEEHSDAFEVNIVFSAAEKLQEAIVKYGDMDGVTVPLFTAPQAVNAELEYLQPADLGDLMRFQETTDDSQGYDISKTAIKRLAELGVVQSHGFGTYGITAFGHFALESMFSQKPSLPLMTNDDRDRAAIQKAEGAKP